MTAPELISVEDTLTKDEVIKQVRAKYPHSKAFITEIPLHGFFAYRPQEIRDVKDAAKAVEEYVYSELEKRGGASAVDALPDDEKNRIYRELDAEAADISTNVTLSLCVLYPFGFDKNLNAGEVPAGIGPSLLQKIVEVSGWSDISVDEI